MACFNFLAASPTDGSGDLFFPRAITPAGDEVYGTTLNGEIHVFTWPGLVYDSTYASGITGSGLDVILDSSGNVFHAVITGGTTCTIYKNGSSHATITVASAASGGGLAWASGYVWVLVSTTSGASSGALYRVDPSSGSVTTAHSVSGSRLSARPYAATDGSLWYRHQTGTATIYRHDPSGPSTSSSTAATVVSHYTPRPSGVMLARRTSSPAAWVDIDPSLTISAAACDPTAVAGATVTPVASFANPDLTDVCLIDGLNDIYRAEIIETGNPWTVGRVAWGTRQSWH